MASPIPIPPAPLEPASSTGPIDPKTEEFSSELREKIEKDFLPNYEPKHVITPNKDQIGDFVINIRQPLQHLNTRTAKAYAASSAANKTLLLYALVCEKNLPVRDDLAKKLLIAEDSPLLKLYSHGVVHISSIKEERYVFIYEQPQGKTLLEIINSQPQAFSDRYVRDLVVTPLNQALKTLEELGFSHGKVNPQNIWIHDKTLKLAECCSEPCGYSQDFHYEPINMIQTHPAAKGNGAGIIDYYALGVIVAYMKLKPRSLQIKSKDVFVRRLLQEGSYIGICGYIDLSEEMNDILRGTLNDNPQDRWTSKQLGPWCRGKRYNLLTPTIANMTGRPFEFLEDNFTNLRQLANAMRKAWHNSLPILQDQSLGRWVEQCTRRREISEYINKVVKGYRTITEQTASEIMTRCLYALDKVAPIHLQHFSLQPDGGATLLAELYKENDADLLEEFKDAVSQSMFSAWQEAQRAIFAVIKLPTPLQQSIWALDRARINIRKNALGFGIERTLYELNPMLPCQSPIIKAHFAGNVQELLIALDHVAKQKDKATVPLDNHIAAFISAKLPLNNTLFFEEYTRYPAMSTHKGLLALKYLERAQVSAKNIRLPGLAAWVVASFSDAIGMFQSRTIRKELSAHLYDLAQEGDLTAILNYLLAYDYSNADVEGYIAASQVYADHTAKIAWLKDDQMLEYRAYKFGNNIAKIIAYAAFCIICYVYFYME